MHEQLDTDYRGARLNLTFSIMPAVTDTTRSAINHPHAELRINGLLRDDTSSDKDPTSLRLSSTVQTDYEWHEFIEGIVDYLPDKVIGRLLASNVELASLTVPRII